MDLISMRRYEAPWRIVPPAIVSNFIFATLTTYTTLTVEVGYEGFRKGIKDVFLELRDTYKLPDTSECEIIQMYVKMYNFHDHNVCSLFSWLQAFSGIMMWSWISGLVIATLRVVVVNDFRIYKVTIYDIPQKHTPDNNNAGTVEESNQNREKEKEL
ncbi:uncharacterized protein LOC143367950 [Andrena cerasifolii]|uniref:uncharacterized protein LOC143367950 n=1 Tax=Andrena cerasifolii TaxID=2819439 RepID=UPI0040378EDF